MNESPESTVSTQEVQDDKKDFAGRFNNWVVERMKTIPPKVMEAKARLQIANSAKEDLETSGEIDPLAYKERFGRLVEKLNERGFTDGTVLKSENRNDSITGKSYFARVRREGQYYVAEEIAHDGRIISQAKIFKEGPTQLTLHFPGQRYDSLNANPGINRNPYFPRTAFSTFELLVETFKKNK